LGKHTKFQYWAFYNFFERSDPPQNDQRPIAVVRGHLRMLRCGPSNRTFVHLAAFLLAETSVCGQSEISFLLHQLQL
jgi:hypothetical protein